MSQNPLVTAFRDEYLSLRSTCGKAIAQLDDQALRRSPDGDVNSVAVIMKHVAGNFLSRFTDFLATDGEKPWRDRDREFVDDFPAGAEGRGAILARWEEGWKCLLRALEGLSDADLSRQVRIRGEAHTVQRALARSLAHAGYHTGQIVLVARMLVGRDKWSVISIPRGGSAEFNRKRGFVP